MNGQNPGKFDALKIDDTVEDGAHKGQVIALFAVFLIGLMSILGLATDVGYAMAAKRAAQGAADAGALNGARMIARYMDAAPTSALPEVTLTMGQNKFGAITPTILTCQYIGSGWNVVGTCNQNVPSSAAGTRIQTKVTFDTFFMQIFPGAPSTISATGYAKARVERAMTYPTNAPVMICGADAWDVTANPATTDVSGAINRTILSGSAISQTAIGKTFRIVDPALHEAGDADCGSFDDRFTGVADTNNNAGKGVGSRFKYLTSGNIQTTTAKLSGPDGCVNGAAAPFDCVMVAPIASRDESTSTQGLQIVAFAAFHVSSVDGVRFNATLLDDYITSGKGQASWCRGCGGIVVVRLIW